MKEIDTECARKREREAERVRARERLERQSVFSYIMSNFKGVNCISDKK